MQFHFNFKIESRTLIRNIISLTLFLATAWLLQSCMGEQDVLAGGLKIEHTDKQIEFKSQWLRLVLDAKRPHIIALSWDGLGKGNLKDNLLLDAESAGGVIGFDKGEPIRVGRVQRDGNVVCYECELPNGGRIQWKISVAADSIHMAVRAKDGELPTLSPWIRLVFDLRVSSIAPLAKSLPNPPAPLPLPCLLHGGKNGSILIECVMGDAALGGFALSHNRAGCTATLAYRDSRIQASSTPPANNAVAAWS